MWAWSNDWCLLLAGTVLAIWPLANLSKVKLFWLPAFSINWLVVVEPHDRSCGAVAQMFVQLTNMMVNRYLRLLQWLKMISCLGPGSLSTQEVTSHVQKAEVTGSTVTEQIRSVVWLMGKTKRVKTHRRKRSGFKRTKRCCSWLSSSWVRTVFLFVWTVVDTVTV